jgi:WD40 repeat protein
VARYSPSPSDRSLISTYTGHDTPDPFQRGGLRERQWIVRLCWSPSGLQIASIGNQHKGAVHVWDPFAARTIFRYDRQRGYHPWTVDGRKEPVSLLGIAWSPRDDQIASSSWNGTVHVFNTRGSLSGRHPAIVYSRNRRDGGGPVAWSPDGQLIACAGYENSCIAVDTWNSSTGETRWTWKTGGLPHNGTLAWSPDGSRLAAGIGYAVHLFDSASGRKSGEYQSAQLRPNTRYHSEIKDISWSADGRYIATTGDCVEIWDASTGTQIMRYDRTDEDGYLNAVAWSPVDGRLASTSARGVHIWDGLNAVQLATYPHEYGSALGWSPDGACLASGGLDRLIRVWRP